MWKVWVQSHLHAYVQYDFDWTDFHQTHNHSNRTHILDYVVNNFTRSKYTALIFTKLTPPQQHYVEIYNAERQSDRSRNMGRTSGSMPVTELFFFFFHKTPPCCITFYKECPYRIVLKSDKRFSR
jgi:hypothetical protein